MEKLPSFRWSDMDLLIKLHDLTWIFVGNRLSTEVGYNNGLPSTTQTS